MVLGRVSLVVSATQNESRFNSYWSLVALLSVEERTRCGFAPQSETKSQIEMNVGFDKVSAKPSYF